MTARQLWKSNPDFRRSIRKILLVACGGAAFGYTWGMIGKRLPGVWGVAWTLAFSGAAIAAGIYMQRDMRRMEKQRLEWEKKNRHLIEEISGLDAKLRAELKGLPVPLQATRPRSWLQ